MKRRVYVASDHGGFNAKNYLIAKLKDEYDMVDLGPKTLDPDDDYPRFASSVATAVVQEPNSVGILVCRSGQGMEITANKFAGIRAALAWNEKVAQESRTDNDANIVSIPADYLDNEAIVKIALAWLNTPFSGEARHLRRINQLGAIENNQ